IRATPFTARPASICTSSGGSRWWEGCSTCCPPTLPTTISAGSVIACGWRSTGDGMKNPSTYLVGLGRFALLPAALSVGCLSAPAGRIEVPSDLMRPPGDGNNGRGRYTVRVTDGDKDWTFTIPEIA